ncbi:hypothetical protein TeGR_g12655, partial [Tetraparma gracilis]
MRANRALDLLASRRPPSPGSQSGTAIDRNLALCLARLGVEFLDLALGASEPLPAGVVLLGSFSSAGPHPVTCRVYSLSSSKRNRWSRLRPLLELYLSSPFPSPHVVTVTSDLDREHELPAVLGALLPRARRPRPGRLFRGDLELPLKGENGTVAAVSRHCYEAVAKLPFKGDGGGDGEEAPLIDKVLSVLPPAASPLIFGHGLAGGYASILSLLLSSHLPPSPSSYLPPRPCHSVSLDAPPTISSPLPLPPCTSLLHGSSLLPRASPSSLSLLLPRLSKPSLARSLGTPLQAHVRGANYSPETPATT